MQIESAAAVISSLPAPISPPYNFPASFRSLQLKPIVTTRATISAALSIPTTSKTLSHLTNLERVLRPSAPAPLINTNDLPPHNTLSHLLQSDPSYSSPRSSIASHWRELHGANDWEDLLDPLNPNLRRELLRYGDLVQSAYHAFFQLSPNLSPPILPNSYRLARHLFTTSSINPPTWFPSASRTNCIGFVAVCDDEFVIHRMGRRDIVVALRGTSTYLEWLENLRINLVAAHLDGKCSYPTWAACNVPKVECGFLALYKTPGPNRQSLSTAVVNEVRRLVEFYKGEELSISIAGHSLGAALALLVADELSFLNGPPIAVYSFGGPRVGNRAFGYRLEKINRVKVLRMVNVHDLVTKVPIGFEGIGIDGYEHVGRELRLDSQVSPFLRPNADPSCCHDLEAYLHLIAGLGGLSRCQFRPNAKRNLLRLLCQQRENFKQIYIHEAQALGLDPSELSPMNCLSC